MPLQPLTIVPKSDPSKFLPRKFSTDNNSIEVTNNQIESSLKAFDNVAKVLYLIVYPFSDIDGDTSEYIAISLEIRLSLHKKKGSLSLLKKSKS